MYKYSSIGQFKNIIKAVHDTANYHNIPVPTLSFTGTVKLHGTNASVYKDFNKDSYVTQSKNNIITPEEDNNGFSAFLHQDKQKNQINGLFNKIKDFYQDSLKDKTVIIYGEWCGGNIQDKVALVKLPRMFVIFNIKISDSNKTEESQDIWLSPDDVSSILSDIDNKNSIYSIYQFPTYKIDIDMNNPKLSQNKLIEITNSVEQECPVGKALGVIGTGEGVVWICTSKIPHFQTDSLKFKVKGREHSVSKVTTIAEVDTAKVNSVNEFVSTVVTENRLKQGIDYLHECNLEVSLLNLGTFIQWVCSDCLKEESDILIESGLEKKDVTKSISVAAKKWFFENLEHKLKFKL